MTKTILSTLVALATLGAVFAFLAACAEVDAQGPNVMVELTNVHGVTCIFVETRLGGTGVDCDWAGESGL